MANISELMGTKSGDLDDSKYGVTIQMEGHTLIPPSGQKGPEETVASKSAPSHLTSPLSGEKANP